ncbi:MAG TPA: ammonium transporter [Methanoregula sp.]|nr:ammonium transporter [Methanoregula sp.]
MAFDSATTVWLMVSAALVMLMIPGVGLFYAGLVRRKNIISMIALSFVVLAVISIFWMVIGYSLAFGPDIGGVIGNLDYAFLNGVGTDAGEKGYPPLGFMVFQLFFAAVTLTIITSGVAERVRLSSFIVFMLLWTTFVYCPIAHWAWGGGWAQSMGLLDFAGGTVVEICSGFSALAIALVIKSRAGFGKYSMEPYNIPLALIGAALLWFGWFGFNAGSALAVNGVAVIAFVNTNAAAAAGTLAWMGASWYHGKPSSLGMVSGAIAGMVAITPAAGYVTPMVSILIGIVAGLICYGAMLFRIRKELDESLDAWAIHGMGGLWGTIATGVFAAMAVCGISGLVEGNTQQFMINGVSALAALVFSFVITYIIASIIDRTMGLRVSSDEEYVGMDISQHGERV